MHNPFYPYRKIALLCVKPTNLLAAVWDEVAGKSTRRDADLVDEARVAALAPEVHVVAAGRGAAVAPV